MSLLEARRRWQQATNMGASSSSTATALPLYSSQARGQSIAQTDPNFFECLICQQEHNIEEIYIAKPCGHEFCRSGARKMALSAIRARSIPVLCPQCLEGDVCSILDDDMQELLDAFEQEEYLAASLAAAGVESSSASFAEVLTECPACESWTSVPADSHALPHATCSSCTYTWCQQCNVPWHTRMSCAEYITSVEDVDYCNNAGIKRDANSAESGPSCADKETQKVYKRCADEDKHAATSARRQEEEDLRAAYEYAALLEAEDQRRAREQAMRWEILDSEFARQEAAQMEAEEREEAAARAAARAARQTFHCAICMDDHPMDECSFSTMCGHCMCREAMRDIALLAIKECALPIECPLCKATPCTECAGMKDAGERYWCCTLDADVQDLLTDEQRTQYLDMSLKAASKTSTDLAHCPQTDCNGLAVHGNDDKLVCNVCEHEWCASCDLEWHYNKTCQQVKDELARTEGEAKADEGFEEYQKENRIIKCPTCKHALMKISGCNRIVCASCRSQVCWLCAQLMDAQKPYTHYKTGDCKGKTYT